ncbi:ABC transporter permease [Chitinophaga nivalis]|uniref:ABC transporter permease n=1 Tax=Chitinophaga nivalis TaxID=2991709 RepID=A0ABT3IMK1_9BACT|nr:ABC transporter permease [Chitinophaga nivalis]MCW3465113.1 ABC transporter permease [Chitinophaga nivalis]MCW3485195.1 ABC transporter permease [Chitinophaga nivalis]
MWRNYFKITWRTLLRHQLFTLINLGGLALGMAACLLILQYVRFERSYENFIRQRDQLVRVTLNLYKGQEFIISDAATCRPLGPTAKATIPGVKDYVRLNELFGKAFTANNKTFLEDRVYTADGSIFRLFSYKMLYGDPATALAAPEQIVLTESTAIKYFGTANVVGKLISFPGGRKIPLKITGVMADLPPNTHLKFSMLVSYPSLYTWNGPASFQNWTSNNDYTYLLLEPGTDLKKLNQQLYVLSKKYAREKIMVAEPLSDIHLYSHKSFEPEENGHAGTVNALLIVAVFIMLIAWINYINLSTARAMERAREVGVRKVVGSGRQQIIYQFLFESGLINGLAAIMALGVIAAAYPFFCQLTHQPISHHIFHDRFFWLVFAGLLLTGTVAAGFYPALVLSSFRPVNVLKGRLSHAAHGLLLRKSLVVLQFTATAVLIAGTFAVYRQTMYMRHNDLGINLHQVITARLPQMPGTEAANRNASASSFRSLLLQLPEVKIAAFSTCIPGMGFDDINSDDYVMPYGAAPKEKSYNYYHFGISAGFLASVDLPLAAGRDFAATGQNAEEILVNEEAAKLLGFASPEAAVGRRIQFTYTDTSRLPYTTIIGVVKNYHHHSLKTGYQPFLYTYRQQGGKFLSIRLQQGPDQAVLKKIAAVWQQVYPDKPFDWFFPDKKYDLQYQADMLLGTIFSLFSALAVFLACLGLFGLAYFTIVQRRKEIGIRKVLGASLSHLLYLLSKDYLKLILLSNIIAGPIAWIGIRSWLNGYAFRIPMQVGILLIPAGVILVIAIVTVSHQTLRTALANPVKSLQSE